MKKIHKGRKWNMRIGVLLLCTILLSGISGCGMFTDVMEAPYADEEEDLIVVGVSQIGSESFWRTANSNSIQKSFTKENGFFLIFENARQKQENQIKSIRSFISQRVDYIVFAPVEESGWDTVLEEAKQANIPVIVMDRNVDVKDESLYAVRVGSNNEEEGSKAGHWLEKELKKQGRADEDINIVVLKGTEGSTAQIGRSNGFMEVAKNYPNWHILEQKCADFTANKGKEVMESFLRKYPDIDVVVSQNDDMTFGAIEAIEEAGRTVGIDGDIMMLSFDAVSDGLKLVQEGKINVDFECNPNQGEMIANVIKMLEAGETVEKQYFVEEDVFTIDNVTDELLDSRTY